MNTHACVHSLRHLITVLLDPKCCFMNEASGVNHLSVCFMENHLLAVV